jgi:hypothetical protein
MVFYPPDWVPKLPFDPPDTVPICDFILDEQHGRLPLEISLDPYTCGISGKSYSAREQKQRTEALARALAKELGWEVNKGTEYDKVAGIFAFNAVRQFPKRRLAAELDRANRLWQDRYHDSQLGDPSP